MDSDEIQEGPASLIATHIQIESMAGSNTIVNDTTSAEPPPQPQQKRFSFYDAKAVGGIVVDTSESSIYKTKDEEINSTRHQFYDMKRVITHNTLPNTDVNLQDLAQQTGPEGRRQKSREENISVPLFSDDIDSTGSMIEKKKIRGNEKNNADEILKSLKATEDRRIQILQPGTTSLPDSPGSCDLSITQDNGSTGFDSSLSTAGFVKTNNTFAINGDGSGVGKGSDDDNLNTVANPYEDTIRVALTLLRKHRSSPKHVTCVKNIVEPSELVSDDNRNNGDDSISSIEINRDRQVEERVCPNFQNSDHGDENGQIHGEREVENAVEDAKIKQKQRLERMAKMASRLQELKLSLPPEQQSKLSNYKHSHDTGENDDCESSLLLFSHEVKERENISKQPEQQVPNHIHQNIKPSLTDYSTGLVSELSQYSSSSHPQRLQHSNLSNQQHVIIEEQVQKGVEKVLLAILEASKNKSAIGGGGESSCGVGSKNITCGHTGITKTLHEKNTNDALLLQVLHELLPSSCSVESSDSKIRKADSAASTTCNKYSASVVSHESSTNNRSTKSSVVDELLAEVDGKDYETKSKTCPTAKNNLTTNVARYWSGGDEKKMTDDSRFLEKQQNDEIQSTSVILSTIDQSKEKNNPSVSTDIEAVKNFHDHANDESLLKLIYSGEDEDGMNTVYNMEEDMLYENENSEGQNVGLLGPLSREAGGTTGVVLDIESNYLQSTLRKEVQRCYTTSLVTNIASGPVSDDEQRSLNKKKKSDILAKYSVVGRTTNIQDEEAMTLMRTLCAHLLPFGVDENCTQEESTRDWDENNPNEPGYRIIRLSKNQLWRVERAFDAMITILKHNSHISLNGVENQFDENFIRELEEAERLLEDEEERKKQEKADETVFLEDTTIRKPLSFVYSSYEDECVTDVSHPEFPGVKSAGKGEMGDLEYFQLPIIFKSHVTGFEPTKDMTLEPGNIIAGQYLVESELGSAAFSTAYRCVDLSSEDNGGHEEVCLKVIKNTKDFFDQSLDEIKVLELLRKTGKCDENYILRVKTFFYYREHLIIVTELLRQNLFEFGKFILDNDEEPYFTLPRLAYITRQCLVALQFVHSLGLIHSDVKPENILLGSYSRAQIKLIDFGSSCYLTDRQSSYIQSRSYRAPEVVLGLPYGGKIDVWSLGCVVAEMYTGEVTFQNDSIVEMLSRIEAFRGSFPRHMIAQGRQCSRYFTKSGLLYEVVGQSDGEETESVNPPAPDDEESDSSSELHRVQFDIFQPKNTKLSSRLGFDANLMDDYGMKNTPEERKLQQIFTDFVARLLTIDPDGRPSAKEALNHPYMIYAESLADDQIKYPSNCRATAESVSDSRL